MKKAKRFLTGLLSAALALSLCAMPAMAEEQVEHRRHHNRVQLYGRGIPVPLRFISMSTMAR